MSIDAMYEVPGSRLRELTDDIRTLTAENERLREAILAYKRYVKHRGNGWSNAEARLLEALRDDVREDA